MAMKKYGYGGAKKRLPKGQKGLAKMTRLVKAAGKGKGTPGRKSTSKAPIRRKMESTAAAKKSLTKGGLRSTGANMRSKLNEALQIASGKSRAKASGKVSPLRKSSTKLATLGMQKGGTVTSKSGLKTKVNRKGVAKKNQGAGRPVSAKKAVKKYAKTTKMQKGGSIGKLTPGMKKVLRKSLKKEKSSTSMMPPGMPRTKKDLKRATKAAGKKATGKGKAKVTRPIPGGKNLPSKRSGTQLTKAQRGRTITSPSGLTQRVTRKGVVKKNQGGGRPMSAKKIVRKISRSRKRGNNSPKSL
tara:strand:+ start:1125 stop:2021 length:897 start_codon:yes stop_codon:yes gene_type:complete